MGNAALTLVSGFPNALRPSFQTHTPAVHEGENPGKEHPYNYWPRRFFGNGFGRNYFSMPTRA
jgi:hypothetical protein